MEPNWLPREIQHKYIKNTLKFNNLQRLWDVYDYLTTGRGLMNVTLEPGEIDHLHPDQINMAAFFWYLTRSEASVHYFTVA